ncbi:sulfate adenylyltransferase, partial [Vibrio owensii]
MPPRLKRKVTLLISIGCLSFQIGALNSKEQRWVDTVTSV